jgi:hypothetical protein
MDWRVVWQRVYTWLVQGWQRSATMDMALPDGLYVLREPQPEVGERSQLRNRSREAGKLRRTAFAASRKPA